LAPIRLEVMSLHVLLLVLPVLMVRYNENVKQFIVLESKIEVLLKKQKHALHQILRHQRELYKSNVLRIRCIMKKIILIYGEDKASKLAIKELNSLRFEYQNLISKNNIQILMIQDNQLDEQHKFESLPSIRFINDEELLNIEGYNIENLNNYEEYF
jgi:hypothetical protein